MTISMGLFAGRSVGLQIARFLRDNDASPAFLVVDSRDDSDWPRKIIEASRLPEKYVIVSDSYYDQDVLEKIRALGVDLFVLAWWPYIIKKALIDIPKIGCVNFHPSLLPYNRGKHYNFWNLVEDVSFGVSLHFIDPGVDSGDIAFQTTIDKSWEDTGETLYHKAQIAIAQLFKDNYARIKMGDIPRKPQDLTQGSFHKSKELEPASKIELERTYTGRQLLNLLRARTFPSHPGAWFVDQSERFEVRIEIKKAN